jgi:hypothetical protein
MDPGTHLAVATHPETYVIYEAVVEVTYIREETVICCGRDRDEAAEQAKLITKGLRQADAEPGTTVEVRVITIVEKL